MDGVLIFDELLADALEARDCRAVDIVLNRSAPDPFANMWNELGRMPDDCKIPES